MKLRIGTRGSDLALWQARHVAARLLPEAECELVVLKTRGDLIDDVPLQTLEGKAFFTGEIERALLDGAVDLAVHSFKDLPTAMTPGLTIAAVPERASQRERLLIRAKAHAPDGAFLPLGLKAKVGTSSPRRAAQLEILRPDLCTVSLRGNVPTRVTRLREGRYDAIVLASAGLDRLHLDLAGLIDLDLELDWFVPAPAQGALAIQIRSGEAQLAALLKRKLHDEHCARAVAAERSLLERAGGGCNLPLGAAVHGSGPYHAFVFLGAGHPNASDRSRWAAAEASTPEQAADAAFAKLAAQDARSGPLANTTIALCGSAGSVRELQTRLAALGARVELEEVIGFEDIAAPQLLERASALRAGDALAVTSREAARRLTGLTVPAGVAIAAVGEATAKALRLAGLEPSIVGEQGGTQLARHLPCKHDATVLFPCAEETSGDLERELLLSGVRVERVPIYRTVRRPQAALVGGADVRIFFSPSCVRAAAALAPAQDSTRLIALGQRTEQACRSLGWPARVASDTHTESVVAEVARAIHDLEVRT